MKAVILAAGEGKRMRPLTDDIPKPMLKILGQPLLEHILDALPKAVDEVVVVVGYRAGQIKQHFGDTFGRFRIQYVIQEKPEGTAKALFLCRELLGDERFLSLYADDLHGKTDLEALLAHPLSVLVKHAEHPERYGVVTVGEGNKITRIVEKPEKPKSDLIVTGPAVLDERIFSIELPRHASGEYYLAEAIGELVKNHPVIAVTQSFWVPIGYPDDIKKAEDALRNELD